MSVLRIQQILNEHSYSIDRVRNYPHLFVSDMMESHPIVIHVMELKPNNREKITKTNPNCNQSYYIPRNRGHLFHPHWIQSLLDRNLRFYLSPVDDDNAMALALQEGRQLANKIRYIFARFTWDPKNPVGVCLHLAENHGNVKFPKRRKLRALHANSIFVDTKTDTVAIQGTDFNLIIGDPFPSDLRHHPNDPGRRIDVGLYSRGLECNASVKFKWYVSLRREDLPRSVAFDYSQGSEDEPNWMEIE